MHYIVLCQYMSTKILERGRMEQKLEFMCDLKKKLTGLRPIYV